TKRDKVRVCSKYVARRVPYQLDPFLSGQPRNARIYRAIKIDRKTESLKQNALAFPLPFERISREMCGQFRVGRRVPNVIIDAVRNADQPIRTPSRKPVEPVTEFGRLNLQR